MLEMCRQLGFRARTDPSDYGVQHVTLSLGEN
jgi:hypothetical protein